MVLEFPAHQERHIPQLQRRELEENRLEQSLPLEIVLTVNHELLQIVEPFASRSVQPSNIQARGPLPEHVVTTLVRLEIQLAPLLHQGQIALEPTQDLRRERELTLHQARERAIPRPDLEVIALMEVEVQELGLLHQVGRAVRVGLLQVERPRLEVLHQVVDQVHLLAVVDLAQEVVRREETKVR